MYKGKIKTKKMGKSYVQFEKLKLKNWKKLCTIQKVKTKN